MAIRRMLPDRPPDAAGLALRLERAEAEQLASAGAPGLAGALEVAGGLAVSKGPGSYASAVFGLGLGGPVSPSALDEVEAHLGAFGGAVRVELCLHADPAFSRELARRGYVVEGFHQVLVRPVLPLPPPGLAVAEVRPIRAGEEGAFAVSARDGVAALSGAGVLPAWRGQGLQLALVRARLAWAAARGCAVAAATTEPGSTSQRTLERAGFRVAYPKAVMVRAAAGPAPATRSPRRSLDGR